MGDAQQKEDKVEHLQCFAITDPVKDRVCVVALKLGCVELSVMACLHADVTKTGSRYACYSDKQTA